VTHSRLAETTHADRYAAGGHQWLYSAAEGIELFGAHGEPVKLAASDGVVGEPLIGAATGCL
jgi:hypothetical protein